MRALSKLEEEEWLDELRQVTHGDYIHN